MRHVVEGSVGGAVGSVEVAHEQLVDYQLVVVGNRVCVVILPVVVVNVAVVDGEHGVVEPVVGVGGTSFGQFVEPFVAIGVEHEACIGIADFLRSVDEVIVAVVLAFLKTFYFGPEIAEAVIVLIFHH